MSARNTPEAARPFAPDARRSDARLQILKAARIVAWGLATAIVVLSLVPAALRPETGVPHDLEHFLIYSATGLAFGLGYTVRRGPLAILLVIFCGAVEAAQLLVPGRHARLSDFAVDAMAVACGVIAAALLSRSARALSRTRDGGADERRRLLARPPGGDR